MVVRIRNITARTSGGLPVPLETGSAAVYPYSPALAYNFNVRSKLGDRFRLYRLVHEDGENRLWLPREMCPMGREDRRAGGEDVILCSSFVPRDEEQLKLVEKAGEYLKEGMSFILRAPTGTGKTVMAQELIARVGKHPLIVVTKEDIRDQWVKAATQFLDVKASEIGFIQGPRFEVTGKKITIAMIQTLSKGLEKFSDAQKAELDQCGFVIFDETHRVGADLFSQACWLVRGKLRLGLSATPHRKDGKDIVVYGHIGPFIGNA